MTCEPFCTFWYDSPYILPLNKCNLGLWLRVQWQMITGKLFPFRVKQATATLLTTNERLIWSQKKGPSCIERVTHDRSSSNDPSPRVVTADIVAYKFTGLSLVPQLNTLYSHSPRDTEKERERERAMGFGNRLWWCVFFASFLICTARNTLIFPGIHFPPFFYNLPLMKIKWWRLSIRQ